MDNVHILRDSQSLHYFFKSGMIETVRNRNDLEDNPMQQDLRLIDSADNLLNWIKYYTQLEEQNKLRILFSNLVSCTQTAELNNFHLHLKIEFL